MGDTFSKIESWSLGDFRAYAEYLNEWPLIEYTLRYMKEHYDCSGRNKGVSRHIATLIRQLADSQASYFLGSWMAFRLGQAIPVYEHQATAENVKYNTLDAAAELMLSRVWEALLLLCKEDYRHVQGKTPLIISVQKGLVAATRLLLDLNVDTNGKDNSGRTALHYAVENGDEAIVRHLVEQGVDKYIEDNSGVTALHLATEK
jgi:hypothetical protein